MPANLPPEYFAAERLYREAKTPEEKAKYLEELISKIPKHKGTDKIRADYRSKLAKLKTAALHAKKISKHSSSYIIEKEGAEGRIIILGPTNIGKSLLVKTLSHAAPEVSDSPYTTWLPTPGILIFNDIHLQLIDTPPLDREFIVPDFLELIKTGDLICIMIDLLANPIEQFQNTIRVLNEHRIYSDHQKEITNEQKPLLYPIIVIVNKDDDAKLDEDFNVLEELLKDEWKLIPISIIRNRNIELLCSTFVKQLKLIRVYSKPPGKEVDLSRPFILKEGNTIDDFAIKVHKDFHEKFKTARVWGNHVFDGQYVGKEHILFDKDIVELHL
jgi:hypothetical protein